MYLIPFLTKSLRDRLGTKHTRQSKAIFSYSFMEYQKAQAIRYETTRYGVTSCVSLGGMSDLRLWSLSPTPIGFLIEL